DKPFVIFPTATIACLLCRSFPAIECAGTFLRSRVLCLLRIVGHTLLFAAVSRFLRDDLSILPYIDGRSMDTGGFASGFRGAPQGPAAGRCEPRWFLFRPC